METKRGRDDVQRASGAPRAHSRARSKRHVSTQCRIREPIGDRADRETVGVRGERMQEGGCGREGEGDDDEGETQETERRRREGRRERKLVTGARRIEIR